MKENIEANKEKASYQNFSDYLARLPPLFWRDYELSTQMSKNRCSFNELEFRRMAEQFDSIFKKEGTATSV
jgi:DNA polymerase-1